ncbi:hypothetical protein PQR75_46775 [Paraburkholderia fungorum]|uniref:beta strand repeat-containing protein n=1 Tax=Paraburkholderia fungorum TaxID=134537 RepID=UPI0038BD4FCF
MSYEHFGLTLTTGPDNLTGTAGNDVFNATVGTVGTTLPTLNPLDSINGNGGSDTLNITDAAGNGLTTGLPSGVSITNIATLNVASAGSVGSGSVLDTTGITGLKAVNVTSNGTDALKAANTVNVTVTNTGAGNVSVTGGAADTINSQGGSVNVSKAAGAVNVNITKAIPASTGGAAASAVPVKAVLTIGDATHAESDTFAFTNPTASQIGSTIKITDGTNVVTYTITAADVAGGANTLATNVAAAIAAANNGTYSATASSNSNLVTVTEAISGVATYTVTTASTAATPGSVVVTGGTTVNVTEIASTLDTNGQPVAGSLNNTAIAIGTAPSPILGASASGYPQVISGLSSDPTGNVTVNVSTAYTDTNGRADVKFGTGVAAIYTNGATTVSATGVNGAMITDVNTTPLQSAAGATAAPGTSVLSTVALDGISGGATITSDALANLTVLDSVGQTVTVTNGITAALNLTVGNVGSSVAALAVTDLTATSVVVGSQASAYAAVNGSIINTGSASFIDLNTPNATSLTFNNAQAVTLTEQVGEVSKVASITVGGAGAVTLNTLDTAATWGKLTSINGASASGAITATIDAAKTSFVGGSGNDTVIISALPTASINGGSGTDTLVLNAASTTFTNSIFANANVTNFETLGLGSAAIGTYDGGGFSSFSLVKTTGAATLTGPVTLSNISATNVTLADQAISDAVNAVTLGFNQDNNNLTLNIGTDSATAPLNNTLSVVTSFTPTASGALAGGVASLTINSAGSASVNSTAGNMVTITDAKLGSLVINGDSSIAVTGTGTHVTSIDASGNTGKAVDVTAVALSAGGATITGGAAHLIANTSTGVDTVTSGAGGVTLTDKAGQAGLTVNLAASANAADDLHFADTSSIVNAGATPASTMAVVNGFQAFATKAATAPGAVSDSLHFDTGVTALFGLGTATSGSVAGGITYTAKGGMLTFGGNGLTGATSTQLINAVEALVNSDATTGAHAGSTAAFEFGGNTYVVHAGATANAANDTVVQLTGVTGITALDTNHTNAATHTLLIA